MNTAGLILVASAASDVRPSEIRCFCSIKKWLLILDLNLIVEIIDGILYIKILMNMLS